MVAATIRSNQRHRRRRARSSAPDVTAQLLYLIAKLGQNARILADLRNGSRLQLAMRLGVEHLVVRSRGGGRRPIAGYESGRARLASIRPVMSHRRHKPHPGWTTPPARMHPHVVSALAYYEKAPPVHHRQGVADGGEVPQPIRLSANAVGWPAHVIDEWLAERPKA